MSVFTFLTRFFRKNDGQCGCPWRTQVAKAKDYKLQYAADLQIYVLEYSTPGQPHILQFLYCPWCGRRVAPPQPWEPAYPHQDVSAEERRRLEQLAGGLESFEAVLAKLGQPDIELRVSGYTRLSQTAEVSFNMDHDKKLRFSIKPKLLPGELERLCRIGVQSAAPNGGPATQPGDPKVTEGPPSVS